jgi:hypothetical protein
VVAEVESPPRPPRPLLSSAVVSAELDLGHHCAEQRHHGRRPRRLWLGVGLWRVGQRWLGLG